MGAAVVLLQLVFSYHTGYNLILLTMYVNKIEMCVFVFFFHVLVSSFGLVNTDC